MNGRTAGLAGAALVSALLAIASAPWALGLPWMNLVFKPVATVLIIVLAWPRGRDTPLQRRWVLAGLGLSLGGDVALLWPQQGFLPGLVSFLLAHAAYVVAFTRDHRLAARVLPFAAYALVAGGIFSLLWPHVPVQMRGPVGGYVVFLAAMAAQAAVLWLAGAPRGAVLALGGALFVCSDGLLATDKFATTLPLASLWILASYWAAQWCIASWLSPEGAPIRLAPVR